MTPSGDLERCVRAALKRHSRVPGISLQGGDRLDGRAGIDSFALLNALLDVEDELGITVDPSRLASVREMSLDDLLALLASCREAPGAPMEERMPGRAGAGT